MKKRLLFYYICFAMCSCKHICKTKDFDNSDWKSAEGTTVILKQGGECLVKGMRWDFIYPIAWVSDTTKYPSSFVGQWSLIENYQKKQEIKIKVDVSGKVASFEVENNYLIKRAIDIDELTYYQFIRH